MESEADSRESAQDIEKPLESGKKIERDFYSNDSLMMI
jgi:hypothetical protein